MAEGRAGLILAAADARRGQVYWQAFDSVAPLSPPTASSIEDAAAFFPDGPQLIVGPGAPLLAASLPHAQIVAIDAPDPASVARLARNAPIGAAPVYLRAPDAKLPGGIDPT